MLLDAAGDQSVVESGQLGADPQAGVEEGEVSRAVQRVRDVRGYGLREAVPLFSPLCC